MFEDRFDAARQLLSFLTSYKDHKDVVIIAIPRGGLELAVVFAQQLNAPIDVIFTKKIGAPDQPELAIGAVSLHEYEIDPHYNVPAFQSYIKERISTIREILRERYHLYRGSKKSLDLHNKIVIITDDGVATGQTLLLALKEIKKKNPKQIIVAIPVIPEYLILKIQKHADHVYCIEKPAHFLGISQFYRHFEQVEDERAIALLQGTV